MSSLKSFNKALAWPALAIAGPAPAADVPPEIVVTASTVDLLGRASTSSEGSVTKQELELRPVYRVGQLLETIPGLAVTSHSGEGKANQYLLRGFNLDHGTDLATYVDGMPVNMRTHAHGQGYTDLNFLIPELAGGVDFTKGPYYAAEGDFSSVGADHIRLIDTMRPTVSVSAGTVGDRRLFAGGSGPLGAGTLLASGEYSHLDGPWDQPDDFRKLNGALRYSAGASDDGVTLTALAYRSRWHATTDQPLRAIEQGLIGRLGTLDPSDGGRASRYSLSATYRRTLRGWDLSASGYAVRQRLTLWNNFTHFLDDPINGDQHAQNDRRTFSGGAATMGRDLGGPANVEQHLTIGIQGRYDVVSVDLATSRLRTPLATVRDDRIHEGNVALFVEDKIRWTPWLRTVAGARVDYFHVEDASRVGGTSGSEHASLLQPKASLTLGPWGKTEFYISAGRGFHSNDGRAGLVENDDGTSSLVRPPLLVMSTGYEAGVRTNALAGLTAAATLFRIDFGSELTYDADAGATEAGRPSRRTGIEVTAQYRPTRWLELNTNLAVARARYRDQDPAGRSIEDAPDFIGSAGIRIANLGRWSGALVYRKLGPHPLLDDNSVRSHGYGEANANIGYELTPALRVELDVYNVGNSHRDAADYYYTTRLPGEPAEGIDGVQIHPLEPRSGRLTITARF